MASTTVMKSTRDLAFNMSLVAYDYAYPDRQKAQKLMVKKLSKKPGVAELMKDGGKNVKFPDVTPSASETSEREGYDTGIWVGMRPMDANKYTKNSAKGSSVNSIREYKKIDYDIKALRVIAPLNKVDANYYSLANPDDDGLCIAYHTPVDEVFFFEEFRDDTTTSTEGRKTNWATKVRSTCKTKERVTWTRDYDKTKFTIEPKRDTMTELSSLISAYQLGGGKQLLNSAKELAEASIDDSIKNGTRKNIMLCKLASAVKALTMDESVEALKELLNMAPDLKPENYEPRHIQAASYGLSSIQAVLDMRYLRPFLVMFMSMHMEDPNRAWPELAQYVLTKVKLAFGHVGLPVEPITDGFERFLDTQIAKLKDIKSFADDSVRSLKKSQGDNILETAPTLPQIWEKYGRAYDTDSRKLLAHHIHIFNVQALTGIIDPVSEELGKEVTRLVKLRAAFPETEDDEGEDDEKEEGHDKEELSAGEGTTTE